MYACGDNTNFCCDTDGVYHGCCDDSNNFLQLQNITQQTTVGVVPSSTATSMPTSSSSLSSSPSSKPSSNHTVAIAVGVAVPVAVIAIGVVAGILFWRRRRTRAKFPPPAPPYPPLNVGDDSNSSWAAGNWKRQSDAGYYAKIAPESQMHTPVMPPLELPGNMEMQELDASKPHRV